MSKLEVTAMGVFERAREAGIRVLTSEGSKPIFLKVASRYFDKEWAMSVMDYTPKELCGLEYIIAPADDTRLEYEIKPKAGQVAFNIRKCGVNFLLMSDGNVIYLHETQEKMPDNVSFQKIPCTGYQ